MRAKKKAAATGLEPDATARDRSEESAYSRKRRCTKCLNEGASATAFTSPDDAAEAHPTAALLFAYNGREPIGRLIDTAEAGCLAFAEDGRSLGVFPNRKLGLRALSSDARGDAR